MKISGFFMSVSFFQAYYILKGCVHVMNQYVKVSVRAASGMIPLENVPVHIEKTGKIPEKRDVLTDINGDTSVSGFSYDDGDEYIVKVQASGFGNVSVFGIKGDQDHILCVLAEPEPSDISEYSEEEQKWKTDVYESSEYKKLPQTNEEITDLINTVSLAFPSVPFFRKDCTVAEDELKTALRCFQKLSGLRESGEADKKTLEKLVWYSERIIMLKNDLYLLRRASLEKRKRIKNIQLYNAVSAAAYFFPGFRKKTDGLTANEVYRTFSEYFHRNERDKYYYDVFRRIVFSIENAFPDHIFTGCGYRFRGTVYRPGDENSDIIMLQSYLKYISYEVEDIGKISVNGQYDRATVNAVRSFQKKYGLYPDGRTDMFTWNGIADLYNYFHKPLAFYKIR